MDFEPEAQANSTTREVRTGRRDGEVTRTIVTRRTFAVDQATLWNVLTNPSRLRQWYFSVKGDLRPGGSYKVDTIAEGIVNECEAPHSFAVTSTSYSKVSWIRVVVTPAADGTQVEVAEETLWDTESWGTYGPSLDGVARDFSLLTLALHLSSGEPVDQEAMGDFTYSPAGREFVRLATQAWANAAVADGDDTQAARNSAARAEAFFVELPEDDFDDFDD